MEFFSSFTFPSPHQSAKGLDLPLGMLITPAAATPQSAAYLPAPPPLCEECGSRASCYGALFKNLWGCAICGHTNPLSRTPASGLRTFAGPSDLSGLTSEFVETRTKPITATSTRTYGYVFVVDEGLGYEALSAIRAALESVIGATGGEALNGGRIALITFSRAVAVYDLSETKRAACNLVSGTCLASRKAVATACQNISPMTTEKAVDGLFNALATLQRTKVPPFISRARMADGVSDDEDDEGGTGLSSSEDDETHSISPTLPNTNTKTPKRCLGAALHTATEIVHLFKQLALNDFKARDERTDEKKEQKSIRLGPSDETNPGIAHVVLFSAGGINCGPGIAEEESLGFSEDLCQRISRLANDIGAVIHGCVERGGEDLERISGLTGGVVVEYGGGESGRERVWELRRIAEDLGAMIGGRTVGYRGKLVIRTTQSIVTRVIGRVNKLETEKSSTSTSIKHSDPDYKDMQFKTETKMKSTFKPKTLTLHLGTIHLRECVAVCLAPSSESWDSGDSRYSPGKSRDFSTSLDPESSPGSSRHIFIQIEVSYVGLDGSHVTRVSTRQWRIATGTEEYMKSISPSTSIVILAKQAALRKFKREQNNSRTLETARDYLDAKLSHISSIFSETGGGVSLRGSVMKVSENIRELVELGYYFRQGPVIGLAFERDPRARLLARRFIHMGVEDCLACIKPRVHAFNTTGAFQALPASSLVLQSDRILIVDQWDTIIIWYGSHVAQEQYSTLRAACTEEARNRASTRTPSPCILEISERSSAERWLLCRISPGHKDRLEDQAVDFPEIKSNGASDLKSRLGRGMSEPSLREYLRSLFAQKS